MDAKVIYRVDNIRRWSLLSAKWIQSTPSKLFTSDSVLILFSHMHGNEAGSFYMLQVSHIKHPVTEKVDPSRKVSDSIREVACSIHSQDADFVFFLSSSKWSLRLKFKFSHGCLVYILVDFGVTWSPSYTIWRWVTSEVDIRVTSVNVRSIPFEKDVLSFFFIASGVLRSLLDYCTSPRW
jgi:hypothetical protein